MKKRIKLISSADIDIAKNISSWDFGNEVLYDLCNKNPNHDCEDKIIAKVWLIGRSYAAALERKRNMSTEPKSDDFYVKTVAPKMKASGLDEWIATIPDGIILSQCQLGLAVKVHWQLTNLFKEIIGNDISKRSLASKYLHFHRPKAFFIFDKRATEAIKQITPSRGIPEIECSDADKSYLDFVQKCLWLREYIKNQFSETLNPRQIDNLLIRTGI
jgi:hypothetical protein